MRVPSFLVVGLAIAFSQPVSAAPLPPTSKWHVDFADSQCVASRDYGSPGDPLFLVFKKPPIGDVLQIAVVWKGALREADQLKGEIVFDDRAPIETTFLEYGVKKLGHRALMINLLTTDLMPMRTASAIHIRSRPETPKRGFQVVRSHVDRSFAISEISTVLDLLKECTDDLQKVWNVWDENRDGVTLKKGPSADLRYIFSPKDYPAAAIRNDLSGTTKMVMLIDEFGKVADCTVTQTSGAASIDAQSCAVIRERGKFRPAIGLDGKPAKSAYSESITWRLEG